MTKRRLKLLGPKEFAFTEENLKLAQTEISKYPEGKQASAVLALLSLAQKQAGGWLPKAAMDCIAETLSMPHMKVYEVATFYSMFNLSPTGKYLVQVCRTTPCWLRGSEKCLDACRKKLAIDVGETTADKKFTLVEVECLGACVNAPVIQINEFYFENLTPEKVIKMLEKLDNKENIYDLKAELNSSN